MTEQNDTILHAEDLCKHFSAPEKVEILKQVSLTVKRNESVAIMGASGEGKSTLLHILGTLEEPTSGTLTIAGRSQKSAAPTIRNRHIGFIFQNYSLLEDYTVLQNVLMPAFIQGKAIGKNSEAYKRALSLLDRVNLLHRKEFMTKVLSGGEKQRVAIARALCNDPELILADEPSGNLDHKSSTQIHQLLLDCVHQFNKGLIVVTHDRALADLCDNIYYLSNGTLTKD